MLVQEARHRRTNTVCFLFHKIPWKNQIDRDRQWDGGSQELREGNKDPGFNGDSFSFARQKEF